MPFTVEDFHDIIRIIGERPEWRAELRRLVLTEELLALPELVRELSQAQKRTEEQLGFLGERMAALAEAQRRTEERLGVLEERMAALADVVRETREQLTGMAKDVGGLKGLVLQQTYRDKVFAYFAPLARRIHLLTGDELQDVLESAVEKGQLTEEETIDLLRADVIARARSKEDAAEIFLVVEVSWGIGPYDVERAVRRAGLLTKTGARTVPVVACKMIDADAMERAREMQVKWVLNGQSSL
ncbi:MAG: hypothetical protein HY671_01480 [Chloroflexi bacterium]|nr:hypothetical protein [Chloroflexota bacterium]